MVTGQEISARCVLESSLDRSELLTELRRRLEPDLNRVFQISPARLRGYGGSLVENRLFGAIAGDAVLPFRVDVELTSNTTADLSGHLATSTAVVEFQSRRWSHWPTPIDANAYQRRFGYFLDLLGAASAWIVASS